MRFFFLLGALLCHKHWILIASPPQTTESHGLPTEGHTSILGEILSPAPKIPLHSAHSSGSDDPPHPTGISLQLLRKVYNPGLGILVHYQPVCFWGRLKVHLVLLEKQVASCSSPTWHYSSQWCSYFCSSPLWEARDWGLNPFWSRTDSSHLQSIAPATRLESCLSTPKEDELPAWADLPRVSSGTMTWRWSGCEGDKLEYCCLWRSVYASWTHEKRLHWAQGLQTKWIVGWIAEVGRDFSRSLVQPSAPSRVIRSDYSEITSLENLKTYPALPPLPISISAQLFSGCKSLWLQPVPLTSPYAQCLPTVQYCGRNAFLYWVTS